MINVIKEYWAQIVVAGLILGAGSAAYVEWRIQSNVTKAVTAAGLVDPAAVDANTESIADLEKVDDKLDSKIERIVDILLED